MNRRMKSFQRNAKPDADAHLRHTAIDATAASITAAS